MLNFNLTYPSLFVFPPTPVMSKPPKIFSFSAAQVTFPTFLEQTQEIIENYTDFSLERGGSCPFDVDLQS